MESCYQFENISMLDHGVLVSEEYEKLLSSLNDGTCEEPILRELYPLFKDQLVVPFVDIYHTFHDCGKPFCVSDGVKKYPDHAFHSSEQWKLLFPWDRAIIELMRLDMVFHEGASDDFYENGLAPILYLTAWAEINANCQMFGGKDSVSYKIKRKKLIQQGKKFLKVLTS